MQDRVALREALLDKRKQLSTSQHIPAQTICQSLFVLKFIEQLGFQYGKSIGGYVAINSEFDPAPLLGNLRLLGFSLSLPYLLDNTHMCFRNYDSNSVGELEKSSIFKICQPRLSAKIVNPQVLLLPLLGFDNSGSRLGYGGGFYDRYLAQQEARGSRPYLLGVGFSGQEVESIEKQAHDYDLDAILTENGIKVFSEATAG